LKFYRDGLGLPTKGIVGTDFAHGALSFFDLPHRVKLAIWPHASLAHEAKVPVGPRSATEFALSHNIVSKAEVDPVMAQVKKADATITDPSQDAPFGSGTLARSKTPTGISGMWLRIWSGTFLTSYEPFSWRSTPSLYR
jgi:uncharacterized protein